jgi:IS30 family transposase
MDREWTPGDGIERATLERLVEAGLSLRAIAAELGAGYTTVRYWMRKEFAISAGGLSGSLAQARVEAAKCVLLCATCHAEIESGAKQLPFCA